MSQIQETLFDLLVNALLQLAFLPSSRRSSRVLWRRREQNINIPSI